MRVVEWARATCLPLLEPVMVTERWLRQLYTQNCTRGLHVHYCEAA